MQIPATVAGIELGEASVRVVVVRTGGRAPRLIEQVEVALDGTGTAAATAAAREAISRLRAKPRSTVLCAPASASVLRLLKVPFRSRRKIAAAVPFELEPTLAIPIEDLIVDYLPARTLPGETEVLALGLRRASLQQQIAALREGGVHVDGVYLDALALTSLWAGLGKRDAAPRAVLHFRPREAVLGVVEAGRLAYLRRLDFNPVEFRANPASVALEVRNLLRGFAAERPDGASLSGLTLTGAPRHEAGRTLFEAELDLPVGYTDLAAELPGHLASDGDELNAWSAPAAAAACAAGGSMSVNFLKTGSTPDLARAALATCLAGAAVLLVYLGFVFLEWRKDRAGLVAAGDAVWREVEATFPDMASLRPDNDPGGAAALALMQDAAIQEADRSQGISLERFSAPPLLDVLMDISAALDGSVVEIESIVQRAMSKEITIAGVVTDAARYNAAVDRLDESPILDVIRDRSTRNNEGGRDTFVLRVKVI